MRRATGAGVPAALAALILWPLYSAYQQTYWIFAAALALTAVCGLSILLFTAADLVLHRRGERLKPIRAFDLILGFALAVPSLLSLEALL